MTTLNFRKYAYFKWVTWMCRLVVGRAEAEGKRYFAQRRDVANCGRGPEYSTKRRTAAFLECKQQYSCSCKAAASLLVHGDHWQIEKHLHRHLHVGLWSHGRPISDISSTPLFAASESTTPKRKYDTFGRTIFRKTATPPLDPFRPPIRLAWRASLAFPSSCS
jgi:hypothetical protein